MTLRQVKAAVCAFVALSAGVALNVTLLQRGSAVNRPGPGGFEPAAQRASADVLQSTAADPSGGKPASTQSAAVSGAIPNDSGANGDGIANVTPPQRAADIAKDRDSFTASDGADVIRAVQRELGHRGYDPGIPNGVANLVTRGAILAYQHDYGLPLTGEPSEALLKAIVFESSVAFGALGRGTGADQGSHARRVVSTVQQWLSALGYPVGKLDGRMGEDTRRSIREFETQQGLPPTGRISGQLVAELARVLGNGRFAAGARSALP